MVRYPRQPLGIILCLLGLFLALSSAQAFLSHRPLLSWIRDETVTSPGQNFQTKYFRVIDYDGFGFSRMKQSTNSTFYSANNVKFNQCTEQAGDFAAGCANDGTGYKVSFAGVPQSDGETTITLRAVETSTGLTGYTSFTLRRDTTGKVNPPIIGNLPNQAVQIKSPSNVATYKAMFVIGDLNENGDEDIGDIDGICSDGDCDFSVTSSDTSILDPANGGIQLQLVPPDEAYSAMEGPRSYTLTATTQPNATGPVTVTIELADPDSIPTKRSTSFVLLVVAATNAPPTISNPTNLSFEEQILPATSIVHPFEVTNDSGDGRDLKVSGFSSNTNLVPNDFVNNLTVTQPDVDGNGSVEIIPVLPLPSPGVPQSATITLSVSDQDYLRQTTFLYVLAPPAGAGGILNGFSRPSGVYLLNPVDVHRELDSFLTGETHGREVIWSELESGPGVFEFDTVFPDLFLGLPLGQTLSLNLQQEPCYIAGNATETWCDTTWITNRTTVLQCPAWAVQGSCVPALGIRTCKRGEKTFFSTCTIT